MFTPIKYLQIRPQKNGDKENQLIRFTHLSLGLNKLSNKKNSFRSVSVFWTKENLLVPVERSSNEFEYRRFLSGRVIFFKRIKLFFRQFISALNFLLILFFVSRQKKYGMVLMHFHGFNGKKCTNNFL